MYRFLRDITPLNDVVVSKYRWVNIASVKRGVIPQQYLIILLPLAAIGLMYLFRDLMRESLLSGKTIAIHIPSTSENDKK